MKYKYLLLIFLFCSAAITGISSENKRVIGSEVKCVKMADECETPSKATSESYFLLTNDFLLFM